MITYGTECIFQNDGECQHKIYNQAVEDCIEILSRFVTMELIDGDVYDIICAELRNGE